MPAGSIITPPADSPSSTTRRVRLDFDPARDGFGFPNSFVWREEDRRMLVEAAAPPASGIVLGSFAALGSVLGGRRGLFLGLAAGAVAAAVGVPRALARRCTAASRSFGLCGGMSLLAMRRWEENLPTPTVLLNRDAVRPLLRLSQAETLRSAGMRFVGYWLQALGGEEFFSREALEREVDKARMLIDEGRVAILGLVGDAPNPFAMHQVLAFGYEVGASTVRFDVYDPNAPGRTRMVGVREDDGRAIVITDLPTGPAGRRGYHISRTPGRLSTLFVVEP